MNFYQELEVPSNASKEQIKKKYKELALRYHPVRHSWLRIKTLMIRKKLNNDLLESHRRMQLFLMPKKELLMIKNLFKVLIFLNKIQKIFHNINGKIRNLIRNLIILQTWKLILHLNIFKCLKCHNTIKVSECLAKSF